MISLLAKAVGGKLLVGLVGIWLKDDAILKLGSVLAIETVQKRASGYLEQRRVKYLLEQIEDEMLESLAGYLDSEYRQVRKGDRLLLAKHAIELVASPSFYEACFEENFDQKRLLARFSEQTEVFCSERLIPDSEAAHGICGFVVAKFLAVLGSFPTFSDDALRALLADTDSLLETVRAIEVELNTLAAKTKTQLLEDERNFRRMVSFRMRKIDVFGIDSRDLPKRYDLSLAYVNLTLTVDPELTNEDPLKTLGMAFADDNKLVVVSGDPGSGKTTLLSWLALRCAEFGLPAGLDTISKKIPIFIRIREYADKELPNGVRLLTDQFGPACDAFTDEWLTAILRDGNFIVFLDGFDEVSDSRRLEVAQWTENLLDYYPEAVAVVSTRTYADSELRTLSAAWGDEDAMISVDPMNPKQIEQFIQKWYHAYSVEVGKTELTNRLEGSKDRLLERLLQNSSLRSLVRNPLICSLICFVNVDRDGFVPDQRGDLYLLATQALLDRRDRERGIVHSQDVSLSQPQKFKILGFIAEYFFKRRSAQLIKSDVVLSIEEYLPALNLKTENAELIVEYLSERSHVLRCPSVGYVDFSHKTFLEYFYARRLTDLSMVEKVADEFFSGDFREVVLFSFAVGTPPFVRDLIGAVISKIEAISASDERNAAILVLQTAIQQASEVDAEMRAAAVTLLSEVLPPKSDSQADELALAGEVILEPLKEFATDEYSQNWRPIVIALLGTFLEDAVYSLRHYAKLNNPTIDKLLLGGRRYFDDEAYRDVVISECKTIKEISVSDADDVKAISKLPTLKSLDLCGYQGEWPVTVFAASDNLESLTISGAFGLTTLDFISSFPNLKAISISGCDAVEDFSPIMNCKKLTSLTIYSMHLQNLEFVKSHSELKEVDLSESTQLTDVSALNTSTELVSLQLPYSHLYDNLNISLDKIDVGVDLELATSFEPTDQELREIAMWEDVDDEY